MTLLEGISNEAIGLMIFFVCVLIAALIERMYEGRVQGKMDAYNINLSPIVRELGLSDDAVIIPSVSNDECIHPSHVRGTEVVCSSCITGETWAPEDDGNMGYLGAANASDVDYGDDFIVIWPEKHYVGVDEDGFCCTCAVCSECAPSGTGNIGANKDVL